MGSILSGNRQPRERKNRTTATQRVRLTHADLYSVKDNHAPLLVPDTNGWATVRYRQREWPVELAYTNPHFGGERRWMLCPRCKGRKQTLHIACDVLACRTCLSLRYESQTENLRARRLRRIEKIRQKLGWQAGLLTPYGSKPPRMQWKTYIALRLELADLTDALLMNMLQWVDRLEKHLNRPEVQPPSEPHAAHDVGDPPPSRSEGK